MILIQRIFPIILFLYHFQQLAWSKSCYNMKILGFRVSPTPEYVVQMQLNPNGTLSTITYVHRDVAIPVWKLLIKQIKIDGQQTETKILFNNTYKLCEFLGYAKRIRLFNKIAENVLSKENGNFSLKCPMRAGTYVMKALSIPSDYLKMLYWPNTLYVMDGAVISGEGKKMKKLCGYQINATVMKSC